MVTRASEVPRRRRAFEAHLAQCEHCRVTTDNSAHTLAPCAAGSLMLAHYALAIAVQTGRRILT